MFGSFLAPRLFQQEGSGGDYTSDPTSSSSSNSRWKNSKTAGALRGAGASLSQSGQSEMDRASSMGISPVSYHRGGKVRKGGMARLLKGERVISKGNAKRVEKMMRKAKMRMKARG